MKSQIPISTRLRRFTVALNHAKETENKIKIEYLENLVRKERDEIALFAKGENE